MTTKICPGCGQEFSSLNRNKYCSRNCSFKSRPVTKRKDCVCELCHEPFQTWESRQGRFCSRKCAGIYAARLPKPWQYKPEIHIKLRCVICSTEFETTTSQVRHRNISCCSLECRYQHQANLQSGPGHHNYRGGSITYRGRNWSRQSRAALKRDGYKCQICHKKLNRKTWDYAVHHITPYRTFNGDYKRANQLINLVSLCRSCHAKVEFGALPCPVPLF